MAVEKQNYLFTSESVSMGHPDKLADRISDGVLDALLEQDPNSRVACETMVTTGVAIIGGGPIGLSLAVACRRQQIPFQLIEAGQLGQTISWWAPQTRWFSSNERISIAGVPLQTIDQSKATREQWRR